MTDEEAFERLGLEPDADPKTIKRAYHQLLRHHKPDRDPQGFRRLRDAYELALQAHARAALEQAIAPVLAPPLEGSPSPSDEAAVPTRETTLEPWTPPWPKEIDPEAVTNALGGGDFDHAFALVMRDTWAGAMIDDDGRLAWATQRVVMTAILVDPTAYETLRERYPDVLQAAGDRLGLQLRAGAQWAGLMEDDVPQSLVDFIVRGQTAFEPQRDIANGRALARWYWSDPKTAWQFLMRLVRLYPAVAALLEDTVRTLAYLDGNLTGPLPRATLPSPSRVLRPLRLATVPLAVAIGLAVYLYVLDDIVGMFGSFVRVLFSVCASMTAWVAAVGVYLLTPWLRRRLAHACVGVDTPPSEVGRAGRIETPLQTIVRKDIVAELVYRVGRLARLEDSGQDSDPGPA